MQEPGDIARRRRVGVALLALVVTAACREPALVTRPPGPPRPVFMRSVWIFDGLAPARIGPRDVLLDEGHIRRIAAPGELAVPPDAHLIEGERFTLMPGLIDVHGHIGNSPLPAWVARFPDPDRNLLSYLYCGVTTVLDPADLASDAFARRAAVARGEKLGPRIFAAGPMFTAPGGHPVAALRLLVPWWLRWYVLPRFTREIGTPEAARAAVAALAPERPDVIKTVVDALPFDGPILPPEVLRATVDEAHARGIRVVAHVGTVADALEAADAGVDAWMHGVYKERIPDELIPRFAAAHMPCVATVNVFDSYADLFEGQRSPTELERQTVDHVALASFLPVPKNYDYAAMQPFFRLLAATREARRENVRRLHAAGVTILAGADAQTGVFPGPGLHRELGKLVESGLSPAEALRAATGDAARFVARSDDPEFGIVADGKIADLLLVEGDPTTDIGVMSHIRAVFQGGVMLERHPVTR